MNTTVKVSAVLVLLSIFDVTSSAGVCETLHTVSGEVKTPLKLSLSEIQSLPSTTVQRKDDKGNGASYEGVAVAEILRRAGVPQDEDLHKEALQLCAVVKAADGYQVVFSLAELDPHF